MHGHTFNWASLVEAEEIPVAAPILTHRVDYVYLFLVEFSLSCFDWCFLPCGSMLLQLLYRSGVSGEF